MAGKTCSICGKPSGMYPICRDCFKLRDEGKIIKCEDCGAWHYANKNCSCKASSTKKDTTKKEYQPKKSINVQPNLDTFANCVVCGAISYGKPQCINCYTETKALADEFDKNKELSEYNDHFYNLKSSIYRMKDLDIIKSNCNKLIAIAYITDKIHDNKSLLDRVYSDVQHIIITRTPYIPKEANQETKKADTQKTELIRTQDGHKVKSDPEKIIDDLLYTSLILHSYEEVVLNIPQEERTVYADWFLPVIGTVDGIYVEYWGMSTKEYLKNKEEKLKLYKKYDVPLIQIQKDEIKGDSKMLKIRILQDLKSLKKKYFNIDDSKLF